MDHEAYLNSGIIEEYCLGLLDANQAAEVEALGAQFPEIKRAIVRNQDALIQLAEAEAKAPPDVLPGIMEKIAHDQALQTALARPPAKGLAQFIPLSPASDHLKWNTLTKDLHPPEQFEVHAHPIYAGKEGQLFVVWIHDKLPAEVHSDIFESILLLEGHCTGKLGKDSLTIRPGDFLEIPLHVAHSLEVTSSGPAKLIVMRRKTA